MVQPSLKPLDIQNELLRMIWCQKQTQQAPRAEHERLWSRCVLKVRQSRLY